MDEDTEDCLKLDKPTFVMSLDLELIWGFINGGDIATINQLKKAGGDKIRQNIDFLLSVLREYDIPATWAVVGHLFLDKCEKEDGIPHKDMPRPKEKWYSHDPCTNVSKDPLYYGKDIVEKILTSPIEHEIGYHSFSHVIFSECTKEVAEAEIRMGIEIAKKFGIELKSFVFPKNKIGHMDVLKKNGFIAYRGKTAGDYDSKHKSLLNKINGAIRRRMPPTVRPKWKNGIWEIPSSMLFQTPWLPLVELGLERTIRHNEIFHIWMHPSNLVTYKSMKSSLKNFLKCVSKKEKEGKINCMTMGKLAGQLNEKKK